MPLRVLLEESYLRDKVLLLHRIWETFSSGTKEQELRFKRMLESHIRAFAFLRNEIGCVDPTIVEWMVIFTVSHVPWDVKPIPVLLSQKTQVGYPIIEYPSPNLVVWDINLTNNKWMVESTTTELAHAYNTRLKKSEYNIDKQRIQHMQCLGQTF